MNPVTTKSRLYTGHVRHRRHGRVSHSFRFPLMMLYLDLSELDTLFTRRWLWSARRPNVAWFRRADYLDPHVPTLEEAVRRRVAGTTGLRPAGPVRVLTHLRTWGYCFNPITIYYCFRADGRTMEAVVTEITNTPWGERHVDVFPVGDSERTEDWQEFGFDKEFHVSPFLPMDLRYCWRFRRPGRTIAVHMDVHRNGERVFDATLALKQRKITGPTLAWSLVRYPAMPLMVIAGIYWQALRLWFKGAPFHPHPGKRRESSAPESRS